VCVCGWVCCGFLFVCVASFPLWIGEGHETNLKKKAKKKKKKKTGLVGW